MAYSIYISNEILCVNDTGLPAQGLLYEFQNNDTIFNLYRLANNVSLINNEIVTNIYKDKAQTQTYANRDELEGVLKGFFKKPQAGGVTLISGTVDIFANLPDATVHDGEVYFVTDNSGGFLSWLGFYKYPKGLYVSNSTTWEQMPLSVKFSEDSLTLLNISNWTEYFNISKDIFINDRLIYNNIEYQNLTGIQIATAPDLDYLNWKVADEKKYLVPEFTSSSKTVYQNSYIGVNTTAGAVTITVNSNVDYVRVFDDNKNFRYDSCFVNFPNGKNFELDTNKDDYTFFLLISGEWFYKKVNNKQTGIVT